MIFMTHKKKNMNIFHVFSLLLYANPKLNLHNQMKRVQDGYKQSHNSWINQAYQPINLSMTYFSQDTKYYIFFFIVIHSI